MKDKAARDINAAKEQAITELYSQAAIMSTQIAGRILKRELNADDQQAIVDESLAQLKAENNWCVTVNGLKLTATPHVADST